MSKNAVKIQMMKTDISAAKTSARWYPNEWRLVAGCSDNQIAIRDTKKLITSFGFVPKCTTTYTNNDKSLFR